MVSDLYSTLAWLPAPPKAFSKECGGLAEKPGEIGSNLKSLASYSLDEDQLGRLGALATKLIRERFVSDQPMGPLTPFRLGVIGNGTLDFIIPALVASALRHGIALECIRGSYDQVLQEALSPQSTINLAKPDAVLVAVDHRGLPLSPGFGESDDAEATVAAAMQFIEAVRTGFRNNASCYCILQTLAAPPEQLFGSFDRVLPGTTRNLVSHFNRELAQSITGTPDLLLDVSGVAETVGLGHWHSPDQWNLAKLPFNNTYLPLYADHVARLLGAARGKSRRCLVLDLDNTVWGGVIGDDGVNGIQIAQGDATGEAHLSVQRLALDLRARGVVLAVSSKNNDEVARSPFREHPEMLLKESDIAVFQANWSDKATNIKAIAQELSLGLDAMVLLDDNPMERDLVRQMLPQVAVPELPQDPALFARTLAAAGYFESVSFSDEDRKRSDFYSGNARRISIQKSAGSLDDYLKSLEMEITFQPFDAKGRMRIAQLIQKSNQFNLTTRRYSEVEVETIENDPRRFTLQVRLADKFGDNGMISVIICREDTPGVWEIDTWLMSCRVLGRRVEEMVLRELVIHARMHGVERLLGRYVPTDRNGMVAGHYQKLGFSKVGEDSANGVLWEHWVDGSVADTVMKVSRSGFRRPVSEAE